MHPRVRTGGKLPNVIGVTGPTGLIADEMRAGDFGGDDDVLRNGGTGVQANDLNRQNHCDKQCGAPAPPFSNLLSLLRTHEQLPWLTADLLKFAGWACSNFDNPSGSLPV